MDHMDMISRNSDDETIVIADPRILAAKNAQKVNTHLSKAMETDYREYFMKAM